MREAVKVQKQNIAHLQNFRFEMGSGSPKHGKGRSDERFAKY